MPPIKNKNMEISALYLDDNGCLCINYVNKKLPIHGFGESLFGFYFLHN